MNATDLLRNARLDPEEWDERSERLRQEVRHRAESTREQLAARAAILGEEVGDRAVVTREALAERYHELEDEFPIEEVVHRARLGAWQTLRGALSVLLVVPAMVVRGLGALSSAVDELSTRGADLTERGRELAGTVRPSRAARRRARVRTAGIAGAGFAAGLITGWILATRDSAVVTYEPALPSDVDYELRAEDPPRDPVSSGADVHVDIDISDASEVESGRDA